MTNPTLRSQFSHDVLLSIADLSTHTGINRATLKCLCDKGLLRSVFIGTGKVARKRFVRCSWWDFYLEQQIRETEQASCSKKVLAGDDVDHDAAEREYIRLSLDKHRKQLKRPSPISRPILQPTRR